jgi:hypothetical protein
MKKALLFLAIIFLVSSVSAACVINLDKPAYFGGETATATMSCGLGSEKSKSYSVVWNNGTDVIETDSGTTPSIVSQAFFETLNIPSGVNWTGANVSLSVDSVFEDFDTFTVNSTGTSSSLIVKNVTFTSASELFLGKILGIRALVEDENGKEISNANCQFDIEDGTGFPITSGTDRSHNGISQTDFLLNADSFDEARQYLARVGCFCGASSTENVCVNEDGQDVSNSIGSATNVFTTLNWLTVNTVTSLPGSVKVGEEFSICANVTNLLANKRIDMNIYYNWRCGSGSDSDTDRIVYGYYSQLRGISANTTQMQCHDFIVPNEEHIEKGSNVCYGATDVSVLNEAGESLVTYSTTSPQFNVSVYSIHPNVEFQRVSKNQYFANVSFNDFDSDVKNVHVIIDGDLNGGDTSLTSITNYSVSYFNGSAVPYDIRIFFHTHAIRYQENLILDDAIEVEIADVNTTLDENFNLTITFENYEERQAAALEGISNKTGTFHLDVNCPSSGTTGSDIECTITAYVEDTQTVQKEVDFTCYISDGTTSYSSINFNQMITRNAFSTTRSFSIPSAFRDEQQYVLQCHADYYNLGSRRDSFFDTFTATSSAYGGGGLGKGEEGTAPITGRAVDEGTGDGGDFIDGFSPFSPQRNWAFVFAEILILIWLAVFISSHVKKKKRAPHYPHSSGSDYSRTFRVVSAAVIILLVLLIIGSGVWYGYGLIRNSFHESAMEQSTTLGVEETSYVLLSGDPAKGIFLISIGVLILSLILILFSAVLVLVISKLLNVRGEIRLGEDHFTRKHHEDRKSAKLQQKLNQLILKEEIKKLRR